MKPKAKTLIQRFGFNDSDLTSPEHDKIVLKLLDVEKMFSILQKACLKDMEVNTYIICENRRYDSYNKKTECKIKEDIYCPFFGNGWTEKIGLCPHADVFNEEWNLLHNLTSSDIIIKNMNIETEVAITTNTKYIVGFIDFKVSLSNEVSLNLLQKKISDVRYFPDFYIEIKPIITSFGETMRQINMYREFCTGEYRKKAEFILITKTTGLNDAFESQGIHVYEWDE